MQHVDIRLAHALSEARIERANRDRRSRGIRDRGLRHRLGSRLIAWGERLRSGEPRIA